MDYQKKDRTNFELIGIEKNNHLKQFHEKNFSNDKRARFIYDDFFKTDINESSTKSGFIICNLPYGKKNKVGKDINDFYKCFINKIRTDFSNYQAAALLPSTFAKKLKLRTLISFKNGGLDVSFCQINPGLNTNSTSMRNQD